jgi:CO/xanthine dehydrogenase Mo-binding subunit
MALSTTLPGAAITFKDGVVEQSNFGDYTVARITDMPKVAVHIVPSSDPPTGMGEPGLPPFAPALANALRRASGKPLRELPLRRDGRRQSMKPNLLGSTSTMSGKMMHSTSATSCTSTNGVMPL